ncbi:MAG: putative ABC transport system ATP-binding protein [Flavobacteriales bacterium]|jgi:putative ABC transport system ATP-binding protein
MIISFSNVIPSPMKEEVFSKESAWNNKFEINSEQNYYLTSGSGKGKSTFCSYIIGLRSDYSGEILIDGKSQRKLSLNEWSHIRKTKIAFLAQDMRLFPTMTVLENLQIKNKLTDYSTEKEFKTSLEQFGLDHKLNQIAGTLSLGQQQRVALVRSLLQPFKFLLMDEPFSHIDADNIKIALQLIQNACEEQNAGMLLTTLGNNYELSIDETIEL